MAVYIATLMSPPPPMQSLCRRSHMGATFFTTSSPAVIVISGYAHKKQGSRRRSFQGIPWNLCAARSPVLSRTYANRANLGARLPHPLTQHIGRGECRHRIVMKFRQIHLFGNIRTANPQPRCSLLLARRVGHLGCVADGPRNGLADRAVHLPANSCLCGQSRLSQPVGSLENPRKYTLR
jgi:hypothetical protein